MAIELKLLFTSLAPGACAGHLNARPACAVLREGGAS